jgi:hypothetical protein
MPIERNRPAKLLTLSPEAWARIDALAVLWGTSRSGAVERLARDAQVSTAPALPPKPPRRGRRG